MSKRCSFWYVLRMPVGVMVRRVLRSFGGGRCGVVGSWMPTEMGRLWVLEVERRPWTKGEVVVGWQRDRDSAGVVAM
jgi:hypothetical protein